MTFKNFATSFTLAIALPFAAQAEEPAKMQWLLAKYDQNGDSSISVDEIIDKKQRLFQYMDTNNDGEVDLQEYFDSDAERRHAILQARFLKLDEDRDGSISGQEYSSFMGLFSSIDYNGDGNLSVAEVQAAEDSSVAKDLCLWRFCFRSGGE